MERPWAKRKVDAVAAHISRSASRVEALAAPGVVGRGVMRVPDDDDRCRARCPADMARATTGAAATSTRVAVSDSAWNNQLASVGSGTPVSMNR